MSRKRLLIAIAAMVCAFRAEAAARRPMPPTLTVQQAVQMALSVNPQLRRADAAVKAARADYGPARAENLPTVMLTGYQSVQTVNLRAAGIDSSTFRGFGGNPIPELFGPFGTFDGRIQVDADVLNLPRQFRQRAERHRVESKESETSNARELLATQVVSQHVDALRAQAFEATAVRQLASVRAPLTITADRFEGGVASGLDRRRARAQAAAAALEEAEANLEAIESEVEMDVRVTLSAFESARLQTETAKKAVSFLEEEVDLSLTRFQEGFSGNSEVVMAQERLARAEQGRVRALFNLNMARIALQRAVGSAAETHAGAKR